MCAQKKEGMKCQDMKTGAMKERKKRGVKGTKMRREPNGRERNTPA